jgi:hypothetical protein
VDTYDWDTNSIPPGYYYICGQIIDGVNTVEKWSPSPLNINSPPSIIFSTQNTGAEVEYVIGDLISVNWTAVDSDNEATITAFYKTANTGDCSDGVQIGGNYIEGTDTGISWNTTGVPKDAYYLCVRIDDGLNDAVEAHTEELVRIFNVCTWNGVSSTLWSTTANWTGCNSSVPGIADKVIVPAAGPPNQPDFDLGFGNIGGFAPGVGGGTITMISSKQLFISHSGQVSSDIIIKADSESCGFCKLQFTGGLRILNDATFDVQDHVAISLPNTVFVGDGQSAGQLY